MMDSLRLILGDLRGVSESAAERIKELYHVRLPVHSKRDSTPVTRADIDADQF